MPQWIKILYGMTDRMIIIFIAGQGKTVVKRRRRMEPCNEENIIKVHFGLENKLFVFCEQEKIKINSRDYQESLLQEG